MKPLNFKYQYFALFFIFLFISIGSVVATDGCAENNRDLSSNIMVSSCIVDNYSSNFNIKEDEKFNNIKSSNIKENNSKSLNIKEDYYIKENNSKSLNIKEDYYIKENNSKSSNIKDTLYDTSVNPKSDDNCICSVGASKTTKTVISSKSLSIDYGADGYVVGYLKTSSGKVIKSKVVKITLNKQTWSKTTDSNGKISLKIPLLNPNTYSVKFSFSTCSGYSASSCLINVTVKRLSTKITANDVYAYDNNNLVAYLKDNKDNPLKNKLVKFVIDGSSFNAFSDSNGQIIFNIPSYLKAKNYSSTIKFIGDQYYLSSSKSVKVYKFDDRNIDSFINQLISSKEFKQILNNNSKDNQVIQTTKNNTLKNSSELVISQLLNNLTEGELESINQFLNLISSNNITAIDLSKFDSTKFKDLDSSISDSEQNTNKKNIIESIWKWLNTPILEIPGYADLDKKYGVFGQSLKLAGWFLLGIDDNGGLTPLDIGLDALSICSGAGLAERLGLSSSSLVLKLADKFPRFDTLLKSSIKIKSLDYSITIKSLFTAYKSSLSILSNPIKFVSNKLITNTLDKWDNKLASFAMGYISNSFLTVSSVLGISEVYVNSKDNTLFTTKILSNIGNANNVELIINSSTSPIASALKNIKSASESISNTIKSVSKTVSTAKNTVSSTVKKVTKSVSKTVSNVVKKVTNTVKKVSKTVKSKVSNTVKTVKKAVKKVVTKAKVTVKKTTKTVKKAVKKVVSKTKNAVKKTVNNVVSKAKITVKRVKKKVNSISAAIKKIKLW